MTLLFTVAVMVVKSLFADSDHCSQSVPDGQRDGPVVRDIEVADAALAAVAAADHRDDGARAESVGGVEAPDRVVVDRDDVGGIPGNARDPLSPVDDALPYAVWPGWLGRAVAD
jgi:hypothetical protein